MKHEYTYKYGRIILKPLEESDIESLRILRNKEKKYFINQDEIDSRMQKQWYKNYLSRDDDIMFKIVDKDYENEFIGAIALYNIDEKKQCADFGRTVIDKIKTPEKGLGLDATKGICHFGFNVLNLRTITAEVLRANTRAMHVYKKAGFYVLKEQKDILCIETTKDNYCSRME